jgi:hypothetical protein
MSLVLNAFLNKGDEKYAKYLTTTHERFFQTSSLNIRKQLKEGENEYADMQKNQFMREQLQIMYADDAESEYIGFVGIDTAFTQPTSLSDYIDEGKPIMPFTPYKSLLNLELPEDVKNALRTTRELTSKIICEEQDFEFARRMPLIYPHKVFQKARQFVQNQHGVSIEQYMAEEDTFNVWNFLGAYCYMYEYEEFLWVNTENNQIREIPVETHLKNKDFVLIL